MLDTSNLSNFLKGITDAIRVKKGTTEPIEHKFIDEEIESITAEDTGIGSRQWWLDVCKERTNFSYMFNSCSNLTTIPQIDTSQGTDFQSMFRSCSKLTTIPQLNTSKGTSFHTMFYNCRNLTTIPQLDTSQGTSFHAMFNSCSNLTTIPQLDTSKGTDFTYMFYSCSKLTTIPQLNTSKGTKFYYMFYDCRNLTTIPQLDTSKGTDFGYMFQGCYNLENIYFVAGCIKKSISFAYSPLLTDESIQSIIDGLADLTGQTAQTLTLHTDVKSKLTQEQIAQITSKNWTLA